MPDISNYERLTNAQLADILDTLSQGQVNDHRGILLLEAARRLRVSEIPKGEPMTDDR